MAFTFTGLTGAVDDTNQASVSTASISPNGSSVLLVAIQTRRTGPPSAPTVTGGSLTYTQVDTILFDTLGGTTRERLTLFRATVGASPGSFTVDFDWGAATQLHQIWSVTEVEGIDTTTPVVQSVNNAADSVSSGSVTLAAYGDAANRPYGTFGHAANEVTTPGSGLTEIHDLSSGEGKSLQTEYGTSADTVIDASWATSSSYGGIAVELAAAGAATQDITPAALTVTATPGTMVVTSTVDITPAAVTVTVTPGGLTVTQPVTQAIVPADLTVTVTPGTMVVTSTVDITPDPLTVTVTPGTMVVTSTADIVPDPITVTITPGTMVVTQPAAAQAVTLAAPTVTVTPGSMSFAVGGVLVLTDGIEKGRFYRRDEGGGNYRFRLVYGTQRGKSIGYQDSSWERVSPRVRFDTYTQAFLEQTAYDVYITDISAAAATMSAAIESAVEALGFVTEP